MKMRDLMGCHVIVGKGATIRILGGAWSFFLEINIFVGKMGEINKGPQGMVEINILSTKEVEINII